MLEFDRQTSLLRHLPLAKQDKLLGYIQSVEIVKTNSVCTTPIKTGIERGDNGSYIWKMWVSNGFSISQKVKLVAGFVISVYRDKHCCPRYKGSQRTRLSKQGRNNRALEMVQANTSTNPHNLIVGFGDIVTGDEHGFYSKYSTVTRVGGYGWITIPLIINLLPLEGTMLGPLG